MIADDNLELLLPESPPKATSYIYATVTAASPLTIALDGDDDDAGNLTPLDMTPLTLSPSLLVNDRVLCVRYGQQLIILGCVNGPKVETGTNASGTYWKYPDGRLLCRLLMSVSLSADNAIDYSWTFPYAFSEEPLLAGIARSTVPHNISIGYTTSGTPNTVASFRLYRSTASTTTFMLSAQGRWKAA